MAAQFGIALFMVVGHLAVFAQLHWLRTNDMGLRKENVLHGEDALPTSGGHAEVGCAAADEDRAHARELRHGRIVRRQHTRAVARSVGCFVPKARRATSTSPCRP
jgi:hypothetical protein